MRQKKILLTTILLFPLIVVVVGLREMAWADESLVQLMPSVDLYTWYEQETGYTPDLETFGIFNVLPLGDELYFGLGTGAPSELDGALLARTDGITVTNLGELDEQGADEITYFNGAIHVAGNDPCCPDGGEAGNHYIYTTTTGLTKYRDPVNGLPYVFHTWGFEIVGDYLYAATSGSFGPPDNIRTGKIFRTTDGVTWELVSYLGSWRTYDIMQNSEQFYALVIDGIGSSDVYLTASRDAQNWTPIVTDSLQPIALREFNGKTLAVSRDRKTIYAVSKVGDIREYAVPNPLGLGWKYGINRNIWVVVEPYLYVIAEQDKGGATMMRSADLIHWETVLTSAESIITLTYWPEKHQLIVTSRERNAALYTLDLPTFERYYMPVILR